MAFTLPELPYAHDALEPHIDARTMEIHHGKHHAGYTNNLNKAVEGSPRGPVHRGHPEGLDMENMALRNNGGGFYNHDLFWKVMSPDGGGSPPATWARPSPVTSGRSMPSRSSTTWRPRASVPDGPGCACPGRKAGRLLHPNQDNPLMPGVAVAAPHPGPGRLGTRLLPPLPEPPSGLHRRLVERGELGRGGLALRGRQVSPIPDDRTAGAHGRPLTFDPMRPWRPCSSCSFSVCLHWATRPALTNRGTGGGIAGVGAMDPFGYADGEGELPVGLCSAGGDPGPFGAHRLYLVPFQGPDHLRVTFGGFGVLVLIDLGHLLFMDLAPTGTTTGCSCGQASAGRSLHRDALGQVPGWSTLQPRITAMW